MKKHIITNEQIVKLFKLVDKSRDDLDEIHRLLLDILETITPHGGGGKGTK
jgi:hypothetical protein